MEFIVCVCERERMDKRKKLSKKERKKVTSCPCYLLSTQFCILLTKQGNEDQRVPRYLILELEQMDESDDDARCK